MTRGKRWRRVLLVFVAAGVLAMLAAVMVFQSAWFHQYVERRVVEELQALTGARVELGGYQVEWPHWRIVLYRLVLRGTEPAGAAPLLEVRRAALDLDFSGRRFHLRGATTDDPRIHLLIDAEGRSNLPGPMKTEGNGSPLDPLFRVAIGELHVNNGLLVVNDRQTAFQFDAGKIDFELGRRLESGADESYVGKLAVASLRLPKRPAVRLSTALRLKRNRVEMQDVAAACEGLEVSVPAAVMDSLSSPAMKIQGGFLRGSAPELARWLTVPGVRGGKFDLRLDTAEFRVPDEGLVFSIQGTVTSSGLTGEIPNMAGRFTAPVLSVAARVDWTDRVFALRGFEARAVSGGSVRGEFELGRDGRLEIESHIDEVSLASLAPPGRPLPWTALVSGGARITANQMPGGWRDRHVSGDVRLESEPGKRSVEGHAALEWDEASGSLDLRDTLLATPASYLRLSGDPRQSLRVDCETKDLDELRPVLDWMGYAAGQADEEFPLQLEPSGAAAFAGTVRGLPDRAEVAGKLRLEAFRVAALDGHLFDRFTGEIDASAAGLRVNSMDLREANAIIAGNLRFGLRDWRWDADATLQGELQLDKVGLARLRRDLGIDESGLAKAIEGGLLDSRVKLAGRMRAPLLDGSATLTAFRLRGEPVDRLSARFQLSADRLRVNEAALAAPAWSGKLRGELTAGAGDSMKRWRNGSGWLAGDVQSGGNGRAAMGRLPVAGEIWPSLTAVLRARGQVDGSWDGETVSVRAVQAELTADPVRVEDRDLGRVQLKLSGARELKWDLDALFRGGPVSGKGTLELEESRQYPAQGQVRFGPLPLSGANELLRAAGAASAPPFEGQLSGTLAFRGPLADTNRITGELQLDRLEISPSTKALAELPVGNSGPVRLRADGKGLHIETFRLTGRETALDLTGTLGYQRSQAWDLRVMGRLDLGLLRDYVPGLNAAGASLLEASVRGPFADPRVNGRVSFSRASFSASGLPNAMEEAVGDISFDRNRATVDRFIARAGGGQVSAGGFIGYGIGSEISYRLQAVATDVRLRYPEGLSSQFNANLQLSGSPSRSLVSGVVTVQRSSVAPETDLGGLLAAYSRGVDTPVTANEFLRGLDYDVRLETAPNLVLTSALTRDLQVDADLRLRGSYVKPVMQGRVNVNRGEIQFFGNRYTITRGQVNFLNPARIEPVTDLDVETRVRGIVVNINFAGPPNRMNISYRSDPPLQAQEIVALLTVGRAPGSTGSTPGTTLGAQAIGAANANVSASTLLGQALAAPVSGRLQRFFGVSRLKIDPNLAGVDAIPQARLVLEQQLSRDVTLTYITNLANVNQQIVRLQWDLDRNWSLLAVRDENGLFGIDVLFKKRFK